ncbi:hypothetical protein GTO10_06485 [Candidatus Saccharibacteria bacterium]|nr:hypothetical protein [Candidatus Saccharibacteria bacterium]
MIGIDDSRTRVELDLLREVVVGHPGPDPARDERLSGLTEYAFWDLSLHISGLNMVGEDLRAEGFRAQAVSAIRHIA